MPDLWYYGRNEQRHGPVPLKELQGLASSGDLDATDLVWSPGMADWMPASEVDGLFSGACFDGRLALASHGRSDIATGGST